jgi:hypothetical protein
MKATWSLVAGVVCIGSLLGCAKQHVEPPPPPPPTVVSTTHEGEGKVVQQHEVTAEATVVAINHDTREVTLRGHDGKTFTMKVGDEVKNLDQVRKGDRVVAHYFEAVAVKLKKPGEAEPSVTAAEGAGTAPLGQMPAGAAATVISVTAKIVKVDRKNQTVTLRGPRGRTETVDVDEPRYLDKVKKGDLVEITYTQALAISVEPTKKRSRSRS